MAQRAIVDSNRRVAPGASGWLRAGVVLGAALICWAAWVVEVFVLNGRGRRVMSDHRLALPLIALVVAWSSSFAGGGRVSARRRWVFVAVAGALIFVAGVVARALVRELLSGSVFSMSLGHLLGLAVVAVALGLLLAGTAHGLLRSGPWVWPRVGLAFLAAVPLGFATIRVIPSFSGLMGDAETLRMGYPVFWFALLVPLAIWKRAT